MLSEQQWWQSYCINIYTTQTRSTSVSIAQHYWGQQFKISGVKNMLCKKVWLPARAAAALETLKPESKFVRVWLVADIMSVLK